MAMNIKMEVERLETLISAFGWEKTKEEKTEEKLIVTIEKKFETPEIEEGPD